MVTVAVAGGEFLGVAGKEVVVQRAADAQQLVRVDGVAVEDFIHVVAAARELPRKPDNGSALRVELVAYEGSDLNHADGCGGHRFPDLAARVECV